MKKCALVGAISFNAEHFRVREFDFVIAVDGGYRHLQDLGVEADVVLGDFDSLGYVPDRENVVCYPEHKDASDIELALEYATDAGYRDLTVYGCLGGRLDHTYGMFQLLARFTKRGKRIFAVGLDTVVTGLCGEQKLLSRLDFSAEAEGIFSLLAFDAEVTGVCERGMEYALDDATLCNTEPLGVSNAFTAREAHIEVGGGTALAFFPVTAWEALDKGI